jgi:hypothetical protein
MKVNGTLKLVLNKRGTRRQTDTNAMSHDRVGWLHLFDTVTDFHVQQNLGTGTYVG